MKKIVKKAVILGIIGFGLGLLISFVVYQLTKDGDERTGEILLGFLAGGLYSAMALSGSVIYDIEEWSILRCTLTHFIIALLGYYSMGTVQGWLIIGSGIFYITTVIFIIAYILVWIGNALYYANKIKMLNQELEKSKNKDR